MHTGLELSLETHYLGLDYTKYIKVSLANINLRRTGSCIICIFISSGNYLLPAFVYIRVWISCISTQTRYPQPASRNSFVFINNPATKFVSLSLTLRSAERRTTDSRKCNSSSASRCSKYKCIQIPIMYCSRSSRLAHRWNSSFDKWKGRVVDAENPAGEFVNSRRTKQLAAMPTSIYKYRQQ
jgi:hypothetical protein